MTVGRDILPKMFLCFGISILALAMFYFTGAIISIVTGIFPCALNIEKVCEFKGFIVTVSLHLVTGFLACAGIFGVVAGIFYLINRFILSDTTESCLDSRLPQQL